MRRRLCTLTTEERSGLASTLRKMTLEEKIGQMIMVWAHVQFLNVESPEYLQMQEEMRTYHVGGFGVTIAAEGGLLTKSEPLEAAMLTNELQKNSKYPLFFAADFERGPSMRLSGATDFPAAMAFGAAHDKNLAREFGRISAEESRAIGVQWNWFPVADVNSNPANPIINTRSFGADPKQVGEMVAAYIEGARSAGIVDNSQTLPRPRRYRYRLSSRAGAHDSERRSPELTGTCPFSRCDCRGRGLGDDWAHLGSGDRARPQSSGKYFCRWL